MIRPSKLSAGDKIGIIATARKISREELAPSILLLESWGLEVVFSPNLFCIENQFAGNDNQRTQDLQWAVDHKELKAVIVARGGYGTSRMIDEVDFRQLKKFPKWFIGFSDITVLLNQLFNEKIQSLHAPIAMLLSKEGHEKNAELLKQILFGEDSDQIRATPSELNQTGVATGQIIGGNLSILHTILSTPSDVNYQNKILFIEDLDEYLYHIDRMMVHLDRAGKLKQLTGVVVGHMSDMNDNAIPFGKTAYQIIHDYCSKYDIPIGFNFPIGHESTNYPVIIGETYTLEVSINGSRLKTSL